MKFEDNMRISLFILSISFLMSCRPEIDDLKFIREEIINDYYYIEYYETNLEGMFLGVGLEPDYYCYFTDRVNFRKYIGRFDSDHYIKAVPNGVDINFEFGEKQTSKHKEVVTSIVSYNLVLLIQGKTFDK